MSEEKDLCEGGSDDNGEWPNTASVPSLPLSRKRPRDEDKPSSNTHLHNESGHGDKHATVSTEFVNNASGDCAQILQGENATKKDAGNVDSEQTSRDDGSANKHSQELSTSKQPSNAWDSYAAAWGDGLSDLADYHEIHGHCNLPQRYSGNTKLAHWVDGQRSNYRLYQEGKTSSMTLSRIQKLESMGFVWGYASPPGKTV
jgi:hypothetical protein